MGRPIHAVARGAHPRPTPTPTPARTHAAQLTAIVYLNDGWTAADGGELRVHAASECVCARSRGGVGSSDVWCGARARSGGHCDIAPLLGRLLVFYSDARVPHEVLPTTAPRHAALLWYYDLQVCGVGGGGIAT